MSIKIRGTGYYVPENTVTNDDLSKMVDTSDEWITQRVGVKQRRISTGETAADFAVKAAERALKSSGIRADELDLIIAATISSDTICPTVAGTVQKEIGASCPAFDVNSACSGFLFALDTAAAYLARNNINKVLVIGAERISKLIDWQDRSTCIIFGDGAGAAVVEKGDGYLSSHIYTAGGDDVIRIPNYNRPTPFADFKEEMPFIHMEGQKTFKFAVNRITEDIRIVAEKAKIAVEDIDFIIPHQANIRIIEFAAKRLGVHIDKFYVNIEKYGNTSSASVPVALAELNESGRLKEGNIIALTAFGGGLSSAACIIKW